MRVLKIHARFNTTLVQLKVAFLANPPSLFRTGSFNTTLVQLKGEMDVIQEWLEEVSIPHWSN